MMTGDQDEAAVDRLFVVRVCAARGAHPMHANACPLSGEPAQWSHRFGWMRFLSEPEPAQRCWGCTTAGMRTLILISITPATSPGAPPAQSTSATNRHKNRQNGCGSGVGAGLAVFSARRSPAFTVAYKVRCFRAASEPRRCCTIRPHLLRPARYRSSQ